MPPNRKNLETSLKYAKWGGYLLNALLLILIISLLFSQNVENNLFKWVKIVYFSALIGVLQILLGSIKSKTFKILFPILCILSIGFVFLMVVEVMFAYMAAAERGERLGVPGFQGSLIFLTLLQVPTILFRRNPDLLD